VLALARRLRDVTQNAGALMIVNDRADVAAIVGADGVHLGQDDLPVAAARRLLRAGAVIGKSTHNIAQARSAVEEGADYIGVGPMFPTQTKQAGPVAGVKYLRQVVSEISLPHVAIGGITAGNVGQLVSAGARRVAVCSAVIAAEDPAAAAAAIRQKLPSEPGE
jgi:thiamine-phosphate pyrophosphorylase